MCSFLLPLTTNEIALQSCYACTRVYCSTGTADTAASNVTHGTHASNNYAASSTGDSVHLCIPACALLLLFFHCPFTIPPCVEGDTDCFVSCCPSCLSLSRHLSLNSLPNGGTFDSTQALMQSHGERLWKTSVISTPPDVDRSIID